MSNAWRSFAPIDPIGNIGAVLPCAIAISEFVLTVMEPACHVCQPLRNGFDPAFVQEAHAILLDWVGPIMIRPTGKGPVAEWKVQGNRVVRLVAGAGCALFLAYPRPLG